MQINVFKVRIDKQAGIFPLIDIQQKELPFSILQDTQHNKDSDKRNSILHCFSGGLSLQSSWRRSLICVLSGSRTIFEHTSTHMYGGNWWDSMINHGRLDAINLTANREEFSRLPCLRGQPLPFRLIFTAMLSWNVSWWWNAVGYNVVKLSILLKRYVLIYRGRKPEQRHLGC